MRALRLLPLPFLAAVLASAAPLPGDANGDGIVNAADHAFVLAVVHRRIAGSPAADVDGDGEVTERDAGAVADIILGQAPFRFQGAATIGPAGGQLAAGDLVLTAGAGALPVDARIVVGAAAQPAGYDGEDDSPLYRIEGFPVRYGAGLTVSLPAASPGRGFTREGEVFLEVGEDIVPTSRQDSYPAMRIVVARLEDGRLVADLPPLDVPPPGRDQEIPDTQTLLVRRVTGVVADEGETIPEDDAGRAGIPMTIYRPVKMTKAQYQPVVDDLGAANIRLKKLGFSLAGRTTPVYVYLKKLDPSICGYYTPSGWGVDYSSLEFNLSYITDATQRLELQRTVFHELFHMLQARFSPSWGFTQAKCVAPTLWFDEACSVWFEKYAPLAAGAVSSMLNQHAHEVLAGHHVDSSGIAALNKATATKAQNHGYGMALMLEFLFSHADAPEATFEKANPALLNVYTAVKAGTAMRDAFVNNVPPTVQWWDEMLAAFVNGTIGGVPFGSSVATPGAHGTAAKMAAEHKGKDAMLLSAPSLGDCQSWAFPLNWQALGPKDKRRLVAEIASPDNKVFSRIFNSARDRTNPVAAEGVSFGKYGTSYVSWLATPMEETNNGLSIRPMHYLLLRHLGDPAASKAAHALRVWYVDPEQPAKTTSMKPDIIEEPKLIQYSLVGTSTCQDALVPYENVLYSDPALTREISRGGASFRVPDDGEFKADIDVTINAEIDPESVYVIKQYRLRVFYYDKSGATREAVLRTYPTPGTWTHIRETITLGANDRHVFITVYADEDFKPGAVLNGVYSMRSFLDVGSLTRYESTLVARYGAKEGSREPAQAAPADPRQTVLRQHNGALTTGATKVYHNP